MSYNIDKFIASFVQKRWQSRFKHEFVKKPHKLMHRCILNWEDIFLKNKLHIHKPKNFDSEIIKILDWGDTITEMEWDKFLLDYPKAYAGFIAIAKSGKLGFLETHESHPKDSKRYYIYET